jgi:nitric oxide reductase subunit B
MDPMDTQLSPWWKRSLILLMVSGFSTLGYLAVRTYRDAPPIPARVLDPAGATLFTGQDIMAGQQVFLSHGLMENGTIWGHGAYLGPDFSAEYLHTMALDVLAAISTSMSPNSGTAHPNDPDELDAEVAHILKENRYEPGSDTLTFTEAEADSFRTQQQKWRDYFSAPDHNGGLTAGLIQNREELRNLTAFFAWAAWASAARRPGKVYSYTNNFPYDPLAGNVPTSDAVLWSAMSLLMLLGGMAAVLFAFGRFDFLGWHGDARRRPAMLPHRPTPSQRATLKYFIIVSLLFLMQALVGGGVAHFRADAASFYGIDISQVFPSQLLRTWHLQLAILWIATAFLAGGLFIAPSLGGRDPAYQSFGVNLLFVALIVVVTGSLLGEWLGIRQMLGRLWEWFGDQGWEYLDLGKAWQIGLAAGLVIWVVLLFRAVRPSFSDPERGELSVLFFLSGLAIPVFYLPAFFYSGSTNFAIVDHWRFWIIHLWVEDFFELFVTVVVAVLFFRLGAVTVVTAKRVIYLDAILYLMGGILGTAHHWYFTGQSSMTMAIGASFSALEIVPLVLLTLDAWDFIRVSEGDVDSAGKRLTISHQWTFYILMAVGFWNFLGAGVFGFLINMPIVSYFEVGTILTPNHAHASFMGVFGMLGVALLVFTCREVVDEDKWVRIEKWVRVSFWGLNLGLASMITFNLFPGGVMQLYDVLQNGYWHARGHEYLGTTAVRVVEWARLPGDLVFIFAGVAPLLWITTNAYLSMRRTPAAPLTNVSARPLLGEVSAAD